MMRKKIMLISDNPSSGEIKNILEDEVTEVYTVSSLGSGFDLNEIPQISLISGGIFYALE